MLQYKVMICLLAAMVVAVSGNEPLLDTIDQLKVLQNTMLEFNAPQRCLKLMLLLDQDVPLTESDVRGFSKISLWRLAAPNNFRIKGNLELGAKLSQVQEKLVEHTDARALDLAKQLKVCASDFEKNLDNDLKTEWEPTEYTGLMRD